VTVPKKWLMAVMPWFLGFLAPPAAHSKDCRYEDRAIEAAVMNNSAVTVTAVSPPEGAEVNGSTVIGVDVEYHIADFEPGAYLLHAAFDTEDPAGMTPGRAADYPKLNFPAGRAHLCIPLKPVYEHPTVRFPLSMHVRLTRLDKDMTTQRAAVAPPMAFRATDLPHGALERMAAAAPPEYHLALGKAYVYFANLGVLYKLCIEKHPDLQTAYTQTYRAWEARHRSDIDLVTNLQFDSYLKRVGGRADLAAKFDDQARVAFRNIYEKDGPAELKRSCDRILHDMAEGENMTRNHIGEQLEIVRKYAPKQDKGVE